MNPIAILNDMMMQALNFFFVVSGNYGIAIIFLTVAVKIALYPLTVQSVQQMLAMQRLQPKMQEIQKKFKDDKEKQQKETMELYKREKMNPLGGCLPMLLQIPFFIALFAVLTSQQFKEILAAAGDKGQFLWMHNLAAPDPTYILIALIALTTYWTQKSMQTSATTQGKEMLYFMPAFIAFVSVGFPAGVQLYWVVSNLITMAQQAYIMKAEVKKSAAKAKS